MVNARVVFPSVASILLIAAIAGPTTAQEGDASATVLLQEASATYANLGGLCSDFHQRLDVTLLRRVREGTGELCQRVPNLFSMRFSDPAGDVIVVDGEFMWMYTPSNDPSQVLQFSAQGVEGRFNFHKAFLEDPVSRFVATDLGLEDVAGRPARVVGLRPIQVSQFVSAKLWLDRESLLIVRVQIEDLNQSVRTITLTNQRMNPDLPDSFFTFTPPPEARVVNRLP
jgi:outer membrane lipoprotein carrier protein